MNLRLPHSNSFLHIAGLALAGLGLTLCTLLSVHHSAAFCPAGTGCDQVLNSAFSTVYGIPLAWFGLAYYAGLLGAFVGLSTSKNSSFHQRLLNLTLGVVFLGTLASGTLIYLQAAVLHAFCPLCTASSGLTFALCAVAASDLVPISPRTRALTLTIFSLSAASLGAATLVAIIRHHQTPAALVSLKPDLARLDGPSDAPVQLIVFSDFDCHHCVRFAATLARIRAAFPREVTIGFRYFPLETASRSFPAAEAAECAARQGKFRPYHDWLFANPSHLSDGDLRAAANAIGLDEERFDQCLRSGAAKAAVRTSYEDANTLGLEGTPTVFLNGQKIGGAIPFEKLAALIRIELARTPQHSSKTAQEPAWHKAD